MNQLAKKWSDLILILTPIEMCCSGSSRIDDFVNSAKPTIAYSEKSGHYFIDIDGNLPQLIPSKISLVQY